MNYNPQLAFRTKQHIVPSMC